MNQNQPTSHAQTPRGWCVDLLNTMNDTSNEPMA